MADKGKDGRWTSNPDTVEVADRYAKGVGNTNEGAGGISNRPLDDEVKRQESLPERNTSRTETTGDNRATETEGVE